MLSDHSFIDFVLEQLTGLGEVRARAMFGGHGLYADEQFFGIIMEGRLYFRAGEQSRQRYLDKGMGPFIYQGKQKTIKMQYYEVPPDTLENRTELIQWARCAAEDAQTKSKLAKKNRPAARNKPPKKRVRE
jgi:DNA transformation protein and related proteins